MKKNLIKILGAALAALMIIALSGCPDPSSGVSSSTTVEIDYDDVLVTSFAGTRWTDGQVPEDTITFSANPAVKVVELEGRYFKKRMAVNGNTTAAQMLIDLSGPHPYESKDADEVESPYQDHDADGVVNVLTDATKRIGIQMYLYRADPAKGKHQRLVVYAIGTLQPREFYLPKK